MTALFLKLLNMSIVASWIILVLLLLRPLLKKAPKWIVCLMWAIVGIRLLVPISFESAFSLLPTAEPIPEDILEQSDTAGDVSVKGVISIIGEGDAPILSVSQEAIEGELSFSEISRVPSAVADPENKTEDISARLLSLASVAWILGMIGMSAYACYSYLRIYVKVRSSVSVGKNAYINDAIDTPFVLGVFRPRIYLPSVLSEQERKHVLLHEYAHLKRLDHIWKPLGYAVLTVYWFNPLVWLAYYLLCKDIEFACDERVIKKLDASETVVYTTTLLQCSVPRKMIAACPLAFGEVRVKERIKTVLHYKKPTLWIMIIAVIACIVLAITLLTDPIDDTASQDSQNESISDNSNTDSQSDAAAIDYDSVWIDVCIDDQKVKSASKSLGCVLLDQEFGPSVNGMLFENAEQLNAFTEQVKFDAESCYDYFSVGDTLARFDETFFKTNRLVLMYSVGSGETLQLCSVTRNNETALITVKKSQGHTDEVRQGFLCIELPINQIEGCTSFKLFVETSDLESELSSSPENSQPDESSEPENTEDPTLDGLYECDFRSIEVGISDFGLERFTYAARMADCAWGFRDEGNTSSVFAVKIESYEQLSIFLDKLKPTDEDKLKYYSDGNILEIYNKKYFEEKAVTIIFTMESSGGNTNKLDAVECKGKRLTISMTKTYGMTADCKELFNCIEYPKEWFVHCSELDVVIDTRHPTEIKTVYQQQVAITQDDYQAFLDYISNFDRDQEWSLVTLDGVENVENLGSMLSKDSALRNALKIYDKAFFDEYTFCMFYYKNASLHDRLSVSDYLRGYQYEDGRITVNYVIHHETNTVQKAKPARQFLLFGVRRHDLKTVDVNVITSDFTPVEADTDFILLDPYRYQHEDDMRIVGIAESHGYTCNQFSFGLAVEITDEQGLQTFLREFSDVVDVPNSALDAYKSYGKDFFEQKTLYFLFGGAHVFEWQYEYQKTEIINKELHFCFDVYKNQGHGNNVDGRGYIALIEVSKDLSDQYETFRITERSIR